MPTTLDDPDQNVRRIELKRRAGQALTNREYDRLAARTAAENQVKKEGGVVRQTLPREPDAGEAYRLSYEGTRRLFDGGQPAVSGTAAAPSPNPITPVTTGLTRRAPGIDVNSYSGSRYNGTATPIAGYQPQPSADAGADRILRARFGPPPNERGQIDIAGRSPVRAAPAAPGGAAQQPTNAGSGYTALPAVRFSGGGGSMAPQTSLAGSDPSFAPSPYAPPIPRITAPQSGVLQPTPDATAPAPASPTMISAPPPQSEANNPLSGDGNGQPEGATSAINPAQAAGLSMRGRGVPRGADEVGTGSLLKRRFSSPQASNAYSGYVKRLFQDPQIA